MPFFGKKFEPKSTSDRGIRCNIGCPVIQEDLDDFKNITLNLGNKEMRFIDGLWVHTTRKIDFDDIGKMTKKMKNLEEENNLNQIKIEVLLDLLTENVSELNQLKVDKN